MDINMAASGQSLSLTLFDRQLEISVFAQPTHSEVSIPVEHGVHTASSKPLKLEVS